MKLDIFNDTVPMKKNTPNPQHKAKAAESTCTPLSTEEKDNAFSA